MNTIDALKRLERAGSEHSRATAKLQEAAATLANVICYKAPVGEIGRTGYEVRNVQSNVGHDTFLIRTRAAEYDDEHAFLDDGGMVEEWINGCGGYLHGDFHSPIPRQTRDGSLRFARDIAGGLLDDIAAYIEGETNEMTAAAATLEKAAAE